MIFWLKKLVYHFFHGWYSVYPPLDPAAVNAGSIPLVWRQWLRELEADVSAKVRHTYTDTFGAVVQKVVIVDSIPGNAAARGTMHRDGPGLPVTMTLTTRSMNNEIYVKHELLHGLQYLHAELFGPLAMPGEFPGDHWPLIFGPYGTH